jgi:glutamate synthase (NADPH) large chain
MSGGIAYVLDESRRVLPQPLQPHGRGSGTGGKPERHQRAAESDRAARRVDGSPRGKWILENWGDMLARFVKVFPHEYKRVLGVAKRETPYFVAAKPGEQVLHG